MKNFIQSQRGSTTMLALSVMFVALGLLTAVSSMVNANVKQSRYSKEAIQIQYAAEAGVKRAIVGFENKLDWAWLSTEQTMVKNPALKYKVEISKKIDNGWKKIEGDLTKYSPDEGKYRIKSIGRLGNRKKIEVVEIYYGKGGGVTEEDDADDNKEIDVFTKKVAFYSDELISIDNAFILVGNTAIASKGDIGDSWWTDKHDQEKILDHRSSPIDFDNFPNPSYQISTTLKQQTLMDVNDIVDESTILDVTAKFTHEPFKGITLELEHNAYSTSGVNASSLDCIGTSSLPIVLKVDGVVKTYGPVTFRNMIIKAKEFKISGSVNLENVKLIATEGEIELDGMVKMKNSSLVAKSSIQVKRAEDWNNVIVKTQEGDIKFTNGPHSLQNTILEARGDIDTSGGLLQIKDSVLTASGSFDANNGIDMENCYINTGDDLTLKVKINIRNSFLKTKKNFLITNGAQTLSNSLILVKEGAKIQSTPQTITKSIIKTYKGDVTFTNKVNIKGIVLAKGKITSNVGGTFEYDDHALKERLKLGDLITGDVLSEYEELLGIPEGVTIENWSKGNE